MTRISQALPSLIDGVTTKRPELADAKYMDNLLNMQINTGTGLSRRLGTKTILSGIKTTTGTLLFSPGDYVKEFELRTRSLFMRVRPTLPIANRADDDIIVFDTDGNIFPVSVSDAAFAYIAENGDRASISLSVHGDTAFITCENVVVSMTNDIRTTINDTLIHVRTAPLLGEVINITLLNQAGTTSPLTVTVGSTVGDNAVSTVANQIAVAINGLAEYVTAVAGATVVVTDALDAAPTAIQTSNESDINIIGDSVESISELTRSAPADKVVEVRTKGAPESTALYMRSEASGESIDVQNQGDITLSATVVNVGSSQGAYKLWSPPSTSFSGSGYGSGTIEDWQGRKVTSISHYEDLPSDAPIEVYIEDLDGLIPAQYITDLLIIDKATGAIVLNSTTSKVQGAPPFSASRFVTDSVYPPGTLDASLDYLIYFNPISTPSFGTGIQSVVWRETSKVNEPYRIDNTTMPVKLFPTKELDGSVSFNLALGAWADKEAGNNKNNPQPAFIGNTIQDTALFQNRFLALSEDNVVLSETDNIDTFFRDTVSQLLSTHPINIRSTSKDADRINTALNHNKDLLLFTSGSQYKLSGGVPLTPSTAGLPQVSSFNSASQVRPASLGNKVYYGFFNRLGKNPKLGINAHVIDLDSKEDTADAITEHVIGLIENDAERIIGNASSGDVVVLSRSGNLYMYNFDRDQDLSRQETRRGAWSIWNGFRGGEDYTIEAASMNDTRVHLVVSHNNQLDLVSLDINHDELTENEIYLDNELTVTSDINGDIQLPSGYVLTGAELLIVDNEDTEIPIYNVAYSVTGPTSIQVDLTEQPLGSNKTFRFGSSFTSQVSPQRILSRDQGRRINSSRRTTILRWLVHLVFSADITAVISNPHNPDREEHWSGLISGDVNTLSSTVANSSSIFKVSFKQPSQLGKLTLKTDSYLGMNITELEWIGGTSARGRRI